MNWLVIDEKYLNYLRKIEQRIPFSDYGKDKYKPFFGVLFETENFYYVTQISHPQDRHLKMKANQDLKKVYLPDSNLAKRCIDFKQMEKLALQYEQGRGNEHGTKNERRTS